VAGGVEVSTTPAQRQLRILVTGLALRDEVNKLLDMSRGIYVSAEAFDEQWRELRLAYKALKKAANDERYSRDHLSAAAARLYAGLMLKALDDNEADLLADTFILESIESDDA
jgi:hypothetical protein